MKEIEQLLTLKLNDAKKHIKEFNCEKEIIENPPPFKKKGKGEKRVIAIKKEANKIKIIWSYEDYI